jgi:hypothetical protein
MIFLPWFAKNVYRDGISGLARLEAALGFGTLAGSIALSFFKLPGPAWVRITSSLGLMGISYLAFTLSEQLLAGCLAVAALGFFLALANVMIINLFQSHPSEEDVPAIMGVVNLISVASLPLSMGAAGIVIEQIPVQEVAWILPVILLSIAATVGLIPGVRKV